MLRLVEFKFKNTNKSLYILGFVKYSFKNFESIKIIDMKECNFHISVKMERQHT
jgi:hypothetical protein